MSEHKLVISQMGYLGAEEDQLLLRGIIRAVTTANAAVAVYDESPLTGDPVAAVIPVGVADELIREGRLEAAPLASLTVLVRDVRPDGEGA